MQFRLPNGMTVASVHSNVCYGLQPGLAYRKDRLTLGLISQLYVEESTMRVMGAPSQTDRFATTNNFIGANYKLGDNDTVVVELEKGRISGNHTSILISTPKIGYEHTSGPLALRAGLMDGEPTYGFGYHQGSLSADFAYMVSPHIDQLQPLGGARAWLFALLCEF
jgi:hypothetical protein